jgi:dihydroxyacid dehydratase/phosphogluconate dehydratase
LGLLQLDALTVQGSTVGETLDAWEHSQRRQALRARLREIDGIDPDDVILSPARARERGLTSTVAFLQGNLAPQGAIVKSTAIDPAVVDPDGVYRKTGPARIFTSEHAAITAIKSHGADPSSGREAQPIRAGDVIVLMGRGPMGSGMVETYEVTSALKHLPWGKEVALITDARFSGVSTGACVGHVGPEALAGGPLGRLREGDAIQILIDRVNLTGSIDLVGESGRSFSPAEGAALLAARPAFPGLAPDPDLPDATRLWAALQNLSGGTWGGCVFDVDAILAAIQKK